MFSSRDSDSRLLPPWLVITTSVGLDFLGYEMEADYHAGLQWFEGIPEEVQETSLTEHLAQRNSRTGVTALIVDMCD